MLKDWKYYNHALISAKLPHEVPNLDRIKDKKFWKNKNGYCVLARYTTEFDCKNITNWWYCIKDTPFDIAELKAKRRYEINKGKKNFEIKKFEPLEIEDDFYEVETSAYSEYPLKYRPIITKEVIHSELLIYKSKPHHIFYGAFDKETGKLEGYTVIGITENVLMLGKQKCNPKYESKGIKAALINGIIEDYNSKISSNFYICDGERPIFHETKFQEYLIKYFNFRKAYSKLNIQYNPQVKYIINILYLLRKILIKLDDFKLIHNINGILKMEEIVRMNRERKEKKIGNIIYDLRRKLQMIAGNIFSPKFMSKIYFRVVMKKKLNLRNPRTFNEKIQWYKLNYCVQNENVIICCDKYRLREYLREKGLENFAVPLVGYWENSKEIDWDSLPNSFVLKCNHGCAYNIICKDKNNFDKKNAESRLSKWLKEDFGKFNAEPHYDKIKKGIVCEKYLDNGNESLIDYKIHCFNGEAKFVLICSNRVNRSVNYSYYDLDWTELNYSNTKRNIFSKPRSLNKMIEISNILAKDFPFIRVDFYEVNGEPFIGELTFVPAGGLDNTLTKEADIEIGKLFDISGEIQ